MRGVVGGKLSFRFSQGVTLRWQMKPLQGPFNFLNPKNTLKGLRLSAMGNTHRHQDRYKTSKRTRTRRVQPLRIR